MGRATPLSRRLLCLVLSAALLVPPPAAAAMRGAADVLRAYLQAPRPRALPGILETLRRERALTAASHDRQLHAALQARVAVLHALAERPDAGFAAVQQAHYELWLLGRDLPELPDDVAGPLEDARRRLAARLEEALLRAAGPTAEALRLSRAPLDDDAVDDASRMSRTPVRAVLQPRADAEVADALAYARRHDLKVSLSGARHSQGGQIVSRGSLHLNFDLMRGASFDPKTGLLTMQAGARWGDVMPLLDAFGMSFDVTQVPNYFSLAGTFGVNAHGHNVNAGPVASTVESLRAMKADGIVVRAGPQENADLFERIFGGFGLFGAVLDARLRVRPNAVYAPDYHIVPIEKFGDFHAEQLAGRPDTPYAHALLSIAPGSFLKEVFVVRYRELPGRIPWLFEVTGRERFERWVNHALSRMNRGWDWSKGLAWWLLTRVLWRFAQKEEPRNRAMTGPFTYFSDGDAGRSQVLQEYFIPRARLNEFIDKARRVLEKDPLNLVMVAVRAVKADAVSRLPHSPTDTFGVVFISDHRTGEASFGALDRVTRKLIDAASAAGGRHYLVYRLAYSLAQLVRSYGREALQSFVADKLRHDPDELLSNKLWETYAHPDPRDARHEFWRLWESEAAPLSSSEIAALRRYRVLFVPGLLGNVYRKIGQYFDESIDELRLLGVEASLVDINTQIAPARAAADFAASLEASDKPVLVFSHSMGGRVVLEALLERPELAARIGAWVPIQAPFGGSAVADGIASDRLARAVSSMALEELGGAADAMSALTTAQSRELLSRRAAEISALTTRVPVLSVATWREPRRWGFDVVLRFIRGLLARREVKDDLLVAAEDAVLPGSDVLLLEGISHAMPVMPSLLGPFDRRRFIRALSALALARARRPR